MGILLLLVQPVMGQQIFVELDEEFPYWIDKTTTTNKSLVAFSPKSTNRLSGGIFPNFHMEWFVLDSATHNISNQRVLRSQQQFGS